MVLTSGGGELGPKARYVLARWVQSFGLSGQVSVGVKELSLRFGVSDAHISQSLKVLVEAGILAKCSVPHGRGRPKGRYEVGSEYAEKLLSIEASGVPHQAVIDQVLRHESRTLDLPELGDASTSLASMWAARKPNQLDVESRLLLAVLLCHADRLGVVRNLGRKSLLKQTGLSRDQLKHRISLLLGLGWLRGYAPGANGVSPFSSIKSTYFINLPNTDTASPESSAVLVCVGLSWPGDREHSNFLLKATTARDDRISEGIEVFFPGSYRLLTRVLGSKLDEYASILLSLYWDDLYAVPFHQDLLHRIETDLLLAPAADEMRDRHTQLVNYVYEQARVVALNVKRSLLMANFPGIRLDELEYSILPGSTDVEAVGVLVFSSNCGAHLPGYHLAVSEGDEIKHQYCLKVEDVALDIPGSNQLLRQWGVLV